MDTEIDALLADVVPEMAEREFDSHQVIKQIFQFRQRAYVGLLAYAVESHPDMEHVFQYVHGRIGKRLKAIAPSLQLSEGISSKSKDIFGQIDGCEHYERL